MPKIGSNFDFTSDQPNFKRDQFETLELMKACDVCDDGHICYNKADGKRYEFKSSNSEDATTGKWREYKAGSDAPIKKGYGYNSVVMNEEENVAYTSYIRVKSGIAKIVVQNSETEIPVDKDPDRTKPQVGNVVNGCMITEVNMSSSSSNWSIKVMLIDSSLYRAEFEADEIYDVYTKNVALGWATAEGKGTSATGFYSHAEGYNTTASGDQSHAEGLGTKATGEGAHAEGVGGSTASGDGAHAEGMGNTASGKCAHAEGSGGTTASGEGSHAEGTGSTASGRCAHAEGSGGVTASGDGAHAEGGGTTASGYTSHAEGSGTTANNQCAHAEGGGSKAYGMYSHAEGSGCEAGEDGKNNTGIAAHAEGSGSKALGSGSHSEGSGTAHGQNSHAEGNGSNAYGTASHAEGSGTAGSSTDSYVGFAHAEGMGTAASGQASHAEGSGTTASGAQAHAEGSGTTASGAGSHTEGSGTTASGPQAHAEGGGTEASAPQAHAEGGTTHATGAMSHAEGGGGYARSAYSHVEGQGCDATGQSAHAEGESTITSNKAEHAEGMYNASHVDVNTANTHKRTRHSVGVGTSSSDRKNAHEIMENGDHYFGDGRLLAGEFGDGDNYDISKMYTNHKVTCTLRAKKIDDNEYQVWVSQSDPTSDYNLYAKEITYSQGSSIPTFLACGSAIFAEKMSSYSDDGKCASIGKTLYNNGSKTYLLIGYTEELAYDEGGTQALYKGVQEAKATADEAKTKAEAASASVTNKMPGWEVYDTASLLADFKSDEGEEGYAELYEIDVDEDSGNRVFDFTDLTALEDEKRLVRVYVNDKCKNETQVIISEYCELEISEAITLKYLNDKEDPGSDEGLICSVQGDLVVYGKIPAQDL